MNRLAVENPDRLELSTAVVAVAEAPGKRMLQGTTGESPFQVTSHDDDDRGVLEFADGSRLQVERVVFDRDSGFAHIGKLHGAPPTPGTLTHLCVDGDRRRALMAAHAACHTVYGCALRLVGQTFAARSRTGLHCSRQRTRRRGCPDCPAVGVARRCDCHLWRVGRCSPAPAGARGAPCPDRSRPALGSLCRPARSQPRHHPRHHRAGARRAPGWRCANRDADQRGIGTLRGASGLASFSCGPHGVTHPAIPGPSAGEATYHRWPLLFIPILAGGPMRPSAVARPRAPAHEMGTPGPTALPRSPGWWTSASGSSPSPCPLSLRIP